MLSDIDGGKFVRQLAELAEQIDWRLQILAHSCSHNWAGSTDYEGAQVEAEETNTYMKNNLQEARWFIKSLESRNETLLRVATAIVAHQRNFLEYGEEGMEPLVLRAIADELELHESTISRVTTQKYMMTPRGLYALKYFFGSHVATDAGGVCSSTAIRALIKQLVAAEDAKAPLSDGQLAEILAKQGIVVARRTVAKYRESLHIPTANMRKSA